MNAYATETDHDSDHHHGPAPGLMRWVTTTNHKDIGTLYLWFSFIMFFIGGAMALVIRTELFQPGLQIVDPHFFNQMTTLHALVMIFGVVMPAFVGLANWMLPMMVGAPDMALPRMNNWSFWILPFGFTMMLSTLFMEGGGPACWAGPCIPAAVACRPVMHCHYLIFSIHLLGVSSIMGAINIVATIMNLRAPGMTFHENAAVRMDLVYYRLPAYRGNAGTGRGGDHAAHRQVLRHQFFRRGRRR